MDPEVLRLFLQTSGSLGGAGKTEDLLMSQLLGYILGGVNAETFAGTGTGSSQLMINYANDPNPAIQTIIQHIQQGTDPYRLSSFVDSVTAEYPNEVADLGFQPADLKNLALAMNKEYTGSSTGSSGGSRGSGSGFNFAKAGLSNPLDLYDLATVPLNADATDFISKQRETGSAAEKEAKESAQRARGIISDMKSKPGKMFREYNPQEAARVFDDVLGSAQTAKSSGGMWIGKISGLANWLKKQDSVTEEQLNKELDKAVGSLNKAYQPEAGKAVEKIKKELKTGKATMSAKADINSPEFWKWRKQVEDARKNAYTAQEAGRQEMAVRESAVEAAKAAGRTPLNDELRTRLSGLAKLRKK